MNFKAIFKNIVLFGCQVGESLGIRGDKPTAAIYCGVA